VDLVHVLVLVPRVIGRQMPMRYVVLRRALASVVDGDGEQRRLLVRVFDSGHVQICRPGSATFLGVYSGHHIQPLKASWSGVPTLFAISTRPRLLSASWKRYRYELRSKRWCTGFDVGGAKYVWTSANLHTVTLLVHDPSHAQ
jgi:hypothetical protein